jgi:hypothetical protein
VTVHIPDWLLYGGLGWIVCYIYLSILDWFRVQAYLESQKEQEGGENEHSSTSDNPS